MLIKEKSQGCSETAMAQGTKAAFPLLGQGYLSNDNWKMELGMKFRDLGEVLSP